MFRDETLGESQGDWRGEPADFHDRQEPNSECSPNLVQLPCTCNDCHEENVYYILNGRDLNKVVLSGFGTFPNRRKGSSTHNQVADKNLPDLGLNGSFPLEKTLQYSDKHMS